MALESGQLLEDEKLINDIISNKIETTYYSLLL